MLPSCCRAGVVVGVVVVVVVDEHQLDPVVLALDVVALAAVAVLDDEPGLGRCRGAEAQAAGEAAIFLFMVVSPLHGSSDTSHSGGRG